MLALSMKQKRYSTKTVGMTIKSIFLRSFASALGSNWMRELPYLYSGQYDAWVGEWPDAVDILVSSCVSALGDLVGRLSSNLLMHGSVSFFLELLRRPHIRNKVRIKLRMLPTRCRRSGVTVWGLSGVRGKPLLSLSLSV
jgi:hypothetical protein